MRCLCLAFSMLVLAMVAVPEFVDAYFWTTRTTSEESQPLTCPEGHLVTGIQCSGAYCDNIQLECSGEVGHGDGSTNTMFRQWRSYISEESPNTAYCNMTEEQAYYPGSQPFYGFVTGVSCKGPYCDEICIECSAVSGNGPDMGQCHWSDWVSEEDGGDLLFPGGYHAIGMQCRGSYCDEKRFLICPFEK